MKKEKGFTIVEVMIVLAIAASILLIVFLAVPALQRNSRNTQRRTDISALLGAVNEYSANNNGALPTASGPFNDAARFGSVYPNLGFYTTVANVQWNYSASVRAVGLNPPAGSDAVTVYNYLKCAAPGSSPISTPTNATIRGTVALFNVEGSAGVIAQCVEN